MSEDKACREAYTQWAEVFYRNADQFTNRDHIIGWNAWLEATSRAAKPAVPEGWRPNVMQLSNAIDVYEKLADEGLPEIGMKKAFLFLLAAAVPKLGGV